jgi:Na+:H+ antiporter
MKVLDLMRGKKLAYMLTLAAILITFGSVRVLGGSGSIAVLVIGLVLGNADTLTGFLRIKGSLQVDQSIRFLHEEVTFFIRTFFFVYLGMMFSFREINMEFLKLCGVVMLIIILVRMISTEITVRLYPEKQVERFWISLMMPRGLASAVLATLPITSGVANTEGFVGITFGVIIVSNVLLTVGMFFSGANKLVSSEEDGPDAR